MSQQQCLPVSNPRKRRRGQQHQEQSSTVENALFDDIENMDASEYLRRVVEQASYIPEVMVSSPATAAAAAASGSSSATTAAATTSRNNNNKMYYHSPIQGSAASLYYLVSHRTALMTPPTAHHVASRAWVDSVLENFSRLREYLELCRAAGVGGKEHRLIPLPKLKDRPGWHVFCVGQDDADGNVGSYFHNDTNDGNSSDNEGSANKDTGTTVDRTTDSSKNDTANDDEEKEEHIFPEWRQNVPTTGYPPTTALLLQMDQVMVRRVMAHLVHYVTSGWSASSSRARSSWLYALLARLDRPLHRDDAAVLYRLLKQLSHSRAAICLAHRNTVLSNSSSHPDPDCRTDRRPPELARLNLLMAIVGIYFEQGGGYDAVMGFHGEEE